MREVINSDYLALVWKDTERRLRRGPPTYTTLEERRRWTECNEMFLELVKEAFSQKLKEELGA